MKKQKKKLTPSQKKELKAKIKRLLLGALHVISYILSVLFILVCVVAGIQSCRGKPQKVNTQQQQNSALVVPQKNEAINRDNTPYREEDLSRIFYPTDITLSSTEYYGLNLNFSNYNYLPYFMPSYEDFIRFDEAIPSGIEAYSYGFMLYEIQSDGSFVEGFTIAGQRFNGLLISFDFENTYLTYSVHNIVDGLSVYSLNLMTFYEDINDTDNYIVDNAFAIEVFDYIFTSNKVYTSNNMRNWSNQRKAIYKFIIYYLSINSFDYNAYMFAGPYKYVSFTNLFRRVYNGFFIYYPGATDFTYSFDLFRGAWEYKNIIYNRITITLQRAWNGTIRYNSLNNVSYEISYYPPVDWSDGPNQSWYQDIFSGDNQALINYYFIKDIVMYSVYDEAITLAYNRLTNQFIPGSTNKVVASVFTSNNIRLWQDDSFLNNNNIEFVVYSIKYYYDISLNGSLFIVYRAYSDFFFSAFYYTGLYHTTKPGTSDDINVFTPVFVILASALTGILPLLNAYLLPGVTIGTLLLLPFVVSIILFVVKLFKR